MSKPTIARRWEEMVTLGEFATGLLAKKPVNPGDNVGLFLEKKSVAGVGVED